MRTIDRFLVQKLAGDVLQEMRISHRWDAIQADTEARERGEKYHPVILANGDTHRQLLARWYSKVDNSGFKSFNAIAATLYEHYDEVLNFFVNRMTNAFAESFNAKIKAFSASLRGVAYIKCSDL